MADVLDRGLRGAGRLLAILTNPPLTSGQRTLGRLEIAREILGFDSVIVANIFAEPTRTSLDIVGLGETPTGWASARADIATKLTEASGILLAYGVTTPSGVARTHHRAQLDWLRLQLAHADLPVWQVGESPRHPSRWQRWTCRAEPGLPFREALARCLIQH